uniref:Chaperone DnaJ C-terminal domain-containing protein n=1 Tax=Timema genevievae TaxID=629358 RepID=A0A7R9JRI4_TIMGE|nr:unnamed protein product [Timema genevievae]
MIGLRRPCWDCVMLPTILNRSKAEMVQTCIEGGKGKNPKENDGDEVLEKKTIRETPPKKNGKSRAWVVEEQSNQFNATHAMEVVGSELSRAFKGTCTTCYGGEIIQNKCQKCGGSGHRRDQVNISVLISKGITESAKVKVMPIRITQAVLDGEIEVKSIDRAKIKVKVPEGTQTSAKLRWMSYMNLQICIIVETLNPKNLTQKQSEPVKAFEARKMQAYNSSLKDETRPDSTENETCLRRCSRLVTSPIASTPSE